jgi:hypothetical protein
MCHILDNVPYMTYEAASAGGPGSASCDVDDTKILRTTRDLDGAEKLADRIVPAPAILRRTARRESGSAVAARRERLRSTVGR